MTETTKKKHPLFMTAAEIREQILDVHPRTLKRAVSRREIRGHLHLGKWRFETESVLAWIAGKSADTQATPESGTAPAKRQPRGRPRKGAAK
jgi:hypothetical protein